MAVFRRNASFEAQMRRDPRFRAGIARSIEPAADHAERFAEAAHAPWMPRSGSRTSRVIVIDTSGPRPRIVNVHHDGHLVEFGSQNNLPHAPLRRGVQAAGIRFTDDPKT